MKIAKSVLNLSRLDCPKNDFTPFTSPCEGEQVLLVRSVEKPIGAQMSSKDQAESFEVI